MNPLFLILFILGLLGSLAAPIDARAESAAASATTAEKNEQVVGAASRLSDKHFDERSFQQRVDTYVRRVYIEFDQWKPEEEQKEIKHVGIWVLNRAERISFQMPLAELTRSIFELSYVLDRLELNADKSIIARRIQPIRSVLAVRASAGLGHHARKKLLTVLDSLHEHIAYWRYQEAHQLYYFFHKSPLKWVSRDTQKQEVSKHLRTLEGARREHFRVLGQLISTCRQFEGEDLEGDLSGAPLAWSAQVVRIIQSMCGRPSLLPADALSYAALINAVSDVTPALNTHRDTIDKVIDRAKKPNHFVRHWIPYTAAVAAVSATVWYLHNHPGQVTEVGTRVKLAAIDNYTTYLKAPFEKVGGALGLWDTGADATSELVEKQVQCLRQGIEQVKGNVPVGKEIVSEELQRDYARILTEFQVWNNMQNRANPASGFSRFGSAVDFDPLDLGDIQEASKVLSGETLDRALDHFLATWKRASLTQKPDLVSQLASIGKLFKDVTAFRGSNVLDGVVKAIGAVEEMIIVNIKQLDEVRTLIKLPIAVIALVSAGKAAQVGYGAAKKGGSMLLPSPYDDAPIRDAILGARDLMDDCKYLDDTGDMSDVQVGKLFYHLTRIGKEAKNVSPEHRKALLKYLRRAEIADSIDGKRVFLKKMYREYKEWHKTADPA
jgi:hypothetical protein